MISSIQNQPQNNLMSFKAANQRLFIRTINWKDAVELASKNETNTNTEWKKALKNQKSAKNKRSFVIYKISKKMGMNFDGSIGNLIDSIIKAFESGKINDTQCFSRIEKIQRADSNLKNANSRVENMRRKSQIAYTGKIIDLAQVLMGGKKL